ncbi:MAG: ParB/RepB/Spo0J family partition protein [Flavobacteriales bacterium]|nr:ParB/RepB/Spo0J family partition protein [Flavobacteriales bacterium]
MAKKSALGRGLGALLDNPASETVSKTVIESDGTTGSINEILIEQIETNPFQPRSRFDQEKLDELAASISQLGIIQPLTLRQLKPNKYQLISGERRFRASQLAGLKSVPAYVRVANDQEMLEMALVENIQRDDLDAIEVAISYQRLIEECDLTQEKLGERVGKNRSTITNYLRLLKLPPQIQKAIMDKVLTMGHARAIINIDDEAQQLELFKQIIKDGLSVRATEQASKSVKNRKISSSKELPIEYKRIQDNIKDQLNAEVGLKVNAKGKGTISIAFDNEKELKRVLSILDLWP